jgi:hypothetical protein
MDPVFPLYLFAQVLNVTPKREAIGGC